MKARAFLSTLALSAGFSTFAMAQVTGTVTLDGKPPALQPINVGAMPQCAKEHPGGTIPNETVLVGAGGGLQNVVVSIKPDEGVVLPGNAPKDPAVLDQKGCQYVPHVVALQVGQPLVVKNSDAFLHNVHSQSENTPFNFAQPMADLKGKKVPEQSKPDYYRIKCDVHPWMAAWVAVIDNPYFAVTDKDGKFELPKGLPNGSYTIEAWHEKYDKIEGKVEVKDGKGDVKLTFKAAAASATPVMDNLIAGAKLAVDAKAPCCEMPSAKALVTAQAK